MRPGICFAVVALVAAAPATADTRVERSYCASAFQYADADEARERLLLAAKTAAVDAMFGQFVSSTTVVSNSILTSDNIVASSVGLIQIEGIPAYSNGRSFGDLCVTVAAIATDDDFAQFDEVLLRKRDCLGDADLTTRELVEEARQGPIDHSYQLRAGAHGLSAYRRPSAPPQDPDHRAGLRPRDRNLLRHA